MRIGSLCTGYGGIELGLAMAGVDVELAWYAEIEPALIPLLADVHPGVPNHGSITEPDFIARASPVDMIVGGIPCQPTSAAGRRLGDADPRWLWPAARRIVGSLLPSAFLLENVRGLVSFDGGKLFEGILNDLRQLGYHVRWLTLGACAIGLAHHRHRVFVYAWRDGMPPLEPERLKVTECGAPRNGVRQVMPSPMARDTGRTAESHMRMRREGFRDGIRNTESSLSVSVQLLPTPTTRDGDGRGTGDAGYWDRRTQTGRTNGFPLDAEIALLANELLPTPRGTDGTKGGPNQHGRRGDLMLSSAVQPERWGRFADAINLQAQYMEEAPPEPSEPNRNGAPRLAASFVEWLMGIPMPGYVTSRLDRLPALKALGNGVAPPQMAAAWRHLTASDRPTTVESRSIDRQENRYVEALDAGGRRQAQADAGAGQRRSRSASAVPHADSFGSPVGTLVGTGDAGSAGNDAQPVRRPRADRGGASGTGRDGLMGTTEEAANLQARLDKRRRDALAAGVAQLVAFEPIGLPDRTVAAVLYVACKSLADSWRAEADAYEGSKKHAESAKVRQRLRDSAAELMGFAGGLLSDDFLSTLDRDDADPERVAEKVNMPAVENSVEALQQHVEQQEAAAAECKHPKETISVLKSGILRCTICGTDVEPEVDYAAAGIAYLGGKTDVMPASFGPPTPPRQPVADGPLHEQPLPLFMDAGGNIANTTMTAPADLTFIDPVMPVQRLSWEQFAAALAELPAEQGTSFSKLEAAADCGMRYALDRMARHNIANLPEPIPAWWEVGGHAFHRAVETIERSIMTGQPLESDNGIWREAFNAVIVETEQASGTANLSWRTNSKGENYDWWTVQGPQMIERYITYRSDDWRKSHQILVLPDGRPALELEVELQVADWPFRAIIDQAWRTPRGFEIIDLKSGATKPPSTFQLGGYAHAIHAEFIKAGTWHDLKAELKIAGAFWDARAGSHDLQVADLLARHPFAELTFRARAHHAMVTTGAFLPRVSNLPGGCTKCVRRAVCPAQVN